MNVELTSLDRVLWPETGFTKADLVDYYRAVAPALVPHVSGRPLTLGRFPDGVDAHGFATTECRGAPDWMSTCTLALRSGGSRRFCVVDDLRSLLWVANLSAIELHGFLGRAAAVEEPASVLFDLDPGPPAGLAECRAVALEVRRMVAREGLDALVKTSGGLGLHVHVPLAAGHSYAQTKRFAREIAESLAADRPNEVTARSEKDARRGKVFVDWLQNDERRTSILPYSLRATDVPQVSTPVTWDEVEHAASLAFSTADVIARVAALGDPFASMLGSDQMLRG